MQNHSNLLLLAVEQVGVVLHAGEPGPAVVSLQVERLRELPGVHRGGAQVAHLARLDHVVQSLERLLQRGGVVEAVG
jgi:hypothetical protein